MSAVAVVGALLLPAITIFSPPGKFERRALHPRAQWAGRLDDRALRELAPPAITDAEALAALWRVWSITPRPPEVDFERELVVVATTEGSRLRLSAVLDDGGDLRITALAAPERAPGFRYAVAIVPRAGVHAVEGRLLAAESEIRTVRWRCDELEVTARFSPAAVALELPSRVRVLARVESGKGERYRATGIELRSSGDAARLEIRGQGRRRCAPIGPGSAR